MPVERKFGWKRDKPDARDKLVALTRKRGVDISNVDLRTTQFLPSVYDQGDTSSCTAQAIAAAVEYDRRKQNISDFPPSRLFIYWNERAIENDTHNDDGAQIRDGLVSLNTKGVCPEPLWPFDASKITTVPPKETYGAAYPYKIKKYERAVDSKGIFAALSQQIPVIFGIEVFDNFMGDDVAKTGQVPMPKGALVGGHAMLIVGAKDDKFIVRNSWGEGWGDKGYCYIPQSYINNPNLSSDMWIIWTA
jgi:C1A family cysteine protease